MTPYIILIAGISGSGKTTYARYLAKKLHVPFIGKDNIKEKLHDVIQYDTEQQGNSQLYGAASYSVFFHIAECLMKADISFVLESNFNLASADILLPIVEKCNYRALTILFDADMEVLYKRIIEREATDERHPGLKIPSNSNINYFNPDIYKNFCVGEKIMIDTTDFTKVDFEGHIVSARLFMGE